MSIWKKILSFLKYFGLIAGSVGIVWGVAVYFNNLKSDIKTYHEAVIDTISELREDFIRFQVETNKGLTEKTGQIDDVLDFLERLDRNQKIIILKSDESQRIIEEIKNQQLINGAVDINFLEGRDAYVVQLKKNELEL